MNKLDYSQIDDLCKSIIHTCNEELGMKTLFCCQGRSQDDDMSEHHSLYPYIAFLDSDRTLRILKELIKSKSTGLKADRLKLYYAPFRSIDKWVLKYRTPLGMRMKKIQLEKFWNDLESDLIEISSKIK